MKRPSLQEVVVFCWVGHWYHSYMPFHCEKFLVQLCEPIKEQPCQGQSSLAKPCQTWSSLIQVDRSQQYLAWPSLAQRSIAQHGKAQYSTEQNGIEPSLTQPILTKPNVIQPSPITQAQPNLAQPSPTQSCPTQSCPTQSCPAQSSPTQSSPTQSSPTQLAQPSWPNLVQPNLVQPNLVYPNLVGPTWPNLANMANLARSTNLVQPNLATKSSYNTTCSTHLILPFEPSPPSCLNVGRGSENFRRHLKVSKTKQCLEIHSGLDKFHLGPIL